MEAPKTREHVVQVSLRLHELRRERDDLERKIREIEAELDAAIDSPTSGPPDIKAGEFTKRVLYLVRDNTDVSATTIAEKLGSRQDPETSRRVHNSLLTLYRQGRIERASRGRWQLKADTTCSVCSEPYSALLYRCPNCNGNPNAQHGGEGTPR